MLPISLISAARARSSVSGPGASRCRRTSVGIGWRERSDDPKRKARLSGGGGWPGKATNGRFARLIIPCRHDTGAFQDTPPNAKRPPLRLAPPSPAPWEGSPQLCERLCA
jgi:hypothetical protein